MQHALGQAVHAMTGVTRGAPDQRPLDALGVMDRFLDARATASSAYWIEQVHQPDAEQKAARKTR
jgi:hypothetical protein